MKLSTIAKIFPIILIAAVILLFTGSTTGNKFLNFPKQFSDVIGPESPGPKTAVVVPLFGEVSESWANNVEKALKDPQNDLVVLWIESPGGGVMETKILTHKIQAYQKTYNKPIYVYSERILASGAYWVAATFDKIIVSPASYSGSIGVYLERDDVSDYYLKQGVKINFIASDSTKVIGNPAIPMKNWERVHWQKEIKQAFLNFMAHVWYYRQNKLILAYDIRNGKLTNTYKDTVSAATQFRFIANGLVYDAQHSLAYGLVDQIMYFDEFVKSLQSKGYKVVTLKGTEILDFYPIDSAQVHQKQLSLKIWDKLRVE